MTAAATAVAAVLTGCGTSTSPSSTPQGDPNAPLEVWTRSQESAAKVYTRIFEEFTKKTGQKVEYKAVFNDFDKQIQQRAANKDLPDLVITDTGSLGVFTQQGLVGEVDRSSIAGSADVSERAWGNAKTADGKFRAVPWSTQANVTLVRKDWREKLGKAVPTTHAELLDLAKAFTTQDPDGNGQADTYGILAPATTDRGYTLWWASSFLWQGGGDVLKDNGAGKFSVAIDSPESERSVEWMRGLFCDSKVMNPNALTLTTNDAHPLFETGKVGIYTTGPYMFSRFDKNLGKDKYEVIPAPKGPGGDTVLGEGEDMYIMAGSPNQAGQKKLVEFMLTPEAQQLGMKVQSGETPVVRLPVNKNVDVKAVLNDPRWDTTKQVYESAGRPFPAVPNFQPFRQKTSESLNKIFTCTTDTKGELAKLAGELSKELSTQGIKQ
ncbi:sugar ABC transporter substrate-binding protein [Kibdelosporangium philippinense]|uniref:Sugar ABC transporter substrate-binding protein n=1 Tax=Kibdelosporangium philippinense TaxID=211113 RepID=A0ABS8ZT65_9PSEU|nr:sugar ABC transporter substrate-binding protein [Kibdelosporangium philippinense]MCE7009633.1 sugar ABC transporter substrate-binding protein [Kibdelosporangium philippinense]